MKDVFVKVRDIRKAIENWHNTVGGALNGQLEAYLGITLGEVADFTQSNGNSITMDAEQVNRLRLLLSDNHKTMIKVYLAKQD